MPLCNRVVSLTVLWGSLSSDDDEEDDEEDEELDLLERVVSLCVIFIRGLADTWTLLVFVTPSDTDVSGLELRLLFSSRLVTMLVLRGTSSSDDDEEEVLSSLEEGELDLLVRTVSLCVIFIRGFADTFALVSSAPSDSDTSGLGLWPPFASSSSLSDNTNGGRRALTISSFFSSFLPPP